MIYKGKTSPIEEKIILKLIEKLNNPLRKAKKSTLKHSFFPIFATSKVLAGNKYKTSEPIEPYH